MELEHSFTVPVGIERAWEVLLDVETVAPCMPGAALDTVDGDAFTGTVKVKLGPIGLTYKGKAAFVEKDAAAHRAVIDAQGRDSRGNGTAKATVTASLQADGDSSTKVTVATDLAITGKPAQFGRGVMVDVGNKLIGQFADCLAGKLSASDEPALAAEVPGPAETSAPTDAGPAADPGAAADAPGTGGGSAEGDGNGAPAAESTSTATSTATAGAAASPTPTAGSAPKHAADTPAASTPAASNGSNALPGASGSSGPRKVTPTAASEPIDLMASAGPAVAKRLAPVGVAVLVAVVLLVLRRRRR